MMMPAMNANNPFLALGSRAAHEYLSHCEMDAVLRQVLPGCYCNDEIHFTDAQIDAIHEAFDLIRDVNLSYEEAFGIDMLCGIVPILWDMLHVQLAFIWQFRAERGDPNGFIVCDLHRRVAAGEILGIGDFWNCCPWLSAWNEKNMKSKDDSGQSIRRMSASQNEDGCN